MDRLLIALVTAFLMLAIIKSRFRFLAWLFPESDDTYRAQLDSFVDVLDDKSVFQVGRTVLLRTIRPIRKFFRNSLKAYGIIGIISLIVNGVVFVFAATLVIATHFPFLSLGIRATIDSVVKAGLFNFSGMSFLVGLLGTSFDLLSLTVTIYLLTQASLAKTSSSLVRHLAIDVFVGAVACMWAYGILDVTLRIYYDNILPHVDRFSLGNPEIYIAPTLWETLNVNPAAWFIVVGLGISAALPTVLYFLILIPVLALRITPRIIQRGMSRIVYLITTDEQPVLKQVATLAGGLGAVIGATIGWLKIAPI